MIYVLLDVLTSVAMVELLWHLLIHFYIVQWFQLSDRNRLVALLLYVHVHEDDVSVAPVHDDAH